MAQSAEAGIVKVYRGIRGMSEDMGSVDASEILEVESKNRAALSVLLDKYSARSGRLLVQPTEMGGTEAFIGSVTLEWFAERVRCGPELHGVILSGLSRHGVYLFST